MTMTDDTTMADCGHTYDPPGPNGGASGYAVTLEGATLCYDCADNLERVDMATHDDMFAYVAGDGRHITTWTGGQLARVTSESRPDIRHTPTGGRYETIYYVAVAADGSVWRGRGPGRGMYVRLKRAAKSPRRVDPIPASFPVAPIGPTREPDTRREIATCGHCEFSWDDSIATDWTPAPAARCPFEPFHKYGEVA